ncbi:MAG: hypothetical protein GY717_06460 [Rhodobacteraceae bacterium]|nr:hypothetical protein [Paracoccaceae bacterium]
MTRFLFVLLLLLPAAARAEFVLSDLVGNWTGSGSYQEGLSKARMRCRLTVVGNNTKVTLSGRCGSSLGSERMVLDLIRRADGTIVLRSGDGAPQDDTSLAELVGYTARTQLFVSGESGHDSASVLFARNQNGTLYFASKRKWQTGNSQSAITLSRR